MSQPLYLRLKTAVQIGDWLGPRIGMGVLENRTSLTLTRIKPGTDQPVAWFLYPLCHSGSSVTFLISFKFEERVGIKTD